MDYAGARRALMRRDPVLAPVIRAGGPCGLAIVPHEDPYTALVRTIVAQQLSARAGDTIFGRVLALAGGAGSLDAASVSRLDDALLRGAGMSRAKVGFVRDLSERVLDGRLDFHGLDHLDDDAAIEALTTVKGIGRWTAEIYLMFKLQRADVLPVDDVGLQRAVQRVYGLRRRPTERQMHRIAEPWRPYRSVACWYLWWSLDQRET
jgi:DNA-3-methyladenine glycosylase II